MRDKAEHKGEEWKGKVKETAGQATANEQWRAKGKAEQAKGKLKQAGDQAKNVLSSDKDNGRSS